MFFKQQGDCLIKGSSIPKKATPIAGNILFESAVTGNKHMVLGTAKLFKDGDTLYIQSNEDFEVIHTDSVYGHKPIQIPAGEYFVDQPLEWDHFAEEERAVAD